MHTRPWVTAVASPGRIVSRMWRFALSRRWWAGHVLVAAGCGLFLVLAGWQWDRAQSVTGDWQNLGYALQWPLFAVFLVVGWLRFLWLEEHCAPQPAPEQHHPVRNSVLGTSAVALDDRPTKDDPDDELAAYNAYLARLAAADRQS